MRAILTFFAFVELQSAIGTDYLPAEVPAH